MLPLSLLNAAQGEQITVECKSGRKYTGEMQACDLFMNVVLLNATCAGEATPQPEVYLRGYSVKYVKIPDNLLDAIMDERQQKRQELFGPNGSRRDRR